MPLFILFEYLCTRHLLRPYMYVIHFYLQIMLFTVLTTVILLLTWIQIPLPSSSVNVSIHLPNTEDRSPAILFLSKRAFLA